MLSQEERLELLSIAKETIEAHVRSRKVPEFRPTSQALAEKRGVFVTIRRDGILRGCIGLIEGTRPLWQAVRDMAVSASTKDPRFPPITEKELPEIEIEISVLTPLERVESIEEIKVGQHGLYVRRGFYSGVLLPQVATEHGWNREEFLEHTCMKAGLPRDAWKKGTEIHKFEAEVFS